MEPIKNSVSQETTIQSQPAKWYTPLTKVTTTSKILAAITMVVLPFVGGYVGWQIAHHESIVNISLNTVTENTDSLKLVYSPNNILTFAVPQDWQEIERNHLRTVVTSPDFELDTSYPDRVVKNGISVMVSFDTSFSNFATSSRSSVEIFRFYEDLTRLCSDCIEVTELSFDGNPAFMTRKNLSSDLVGSPAGEYIELIILNEQMVLKFVIEYNSYSDSVRKLMTALLKSIIINKDFSVINPDNSGKVNQDLQSRHTLRYGNKEDAQSYFNDQTLPDQVIENVALHSSVSYLKDIPFLTLVATSTDGRMFFTKHCFKATSCNFAYLYEYDPIVSEITQMKVAKYYDEVFYGSKVIPNTHYALSVVDSSGKVELLLIDFMRDNTVVLASESDTGNFFCLPGIGCDLVFEKIDDRAVNVLIYTVNQRIGESYDWQSISTSTKTYSW